MKVGNCIIGKYNYDEYGNATKITYDEFINVPQSCAISLRGNPSISDGVEVTYGNYNMYEIGLSDSINSVEQFKVNYNNGTLFVHPKLESNMIKVHYDSIGADLIYVDRICYKTNSAGEVEKTLEDYFIAGETVVKALEEIGDVVTILNLLTESVKTANELNTQITTKVKEGNEACEQISTSISEANVIYPKLHTDVQQASVLEPDLSQAIADGRIVNTNLVTTIENAETAKTNLETTITNAEQAKADLIAEIGNANIDGMNTAIQENATNIANLTNDKQDKTDNTLKTTDKTIAGAINELKTASDTHGASIDEINNNITNLQNGKMDSSKGTSDNPFSSIYTNNYLNDTKGYTELPNGWKIATGTVDLRIDGTDSELEVTLPCSFTSTTSFKGFANAGASNKLVCTAYPTATNKIKIYGWTTTTVGYTYKVQWTAIGY